MSVFHHFLKIFLVLSSFLLDPDLDPYYFWLDPDPYQSSPWIQIRNASLHILESGSISKLYGFATLSVWTQYAGYCSVLYSRVLYSASKSMDQICRIYQ